MSLCPLLMPPSNRPGGACCLLCAVQQSESVGLVVISEGDRNTLLIHRISPDCVYQRQVTDAPENSS